MDDREFAELLEVNRQEMRGFLRESIERDRQYREVIARIDGRLSETIERLDLLGVSNGVLMDWLQQHRSDPDAHG